MTKSDFMREAFSDMGDHVHRACYDAILKGDLVEVSRLIGAATTQAVVEHESDLDWRWAAKAEMNMEKILDDRDRARDINKANKEIT